jgi:hypothetical protein
MSEQFGTQTPQVEGSDYNVLAFVIQQMLTKVNTCAVVQVVACTNDGAVSAVGTVDVQPLVNQMTGARVAVPHGTIYKLPYSRVQGGTNAIIMDPAPGDIGVVVFSQRDISSVKASKAQANPGSFRTFNWADGIYVGAILNGTPQQYIQFSSAGVLTNSPTEITLTAPAILLDGEVEVTGAATFDGTILVDGVATMAAVIAASITAPVGAITALEVSSISPIGGGSFPTPTFPVAVADSITGDGLTGSPLALVGDTASPGNSMVYGTNSSGIRGWYPAGGGGGAGTVTSVSAGSSDIVIGGVPTVTPSVDLSSTAKADLALAVSALQSISIATGTGLTGGPLGASGSTVALSAGSIAGLALAATALQSISIATGAGLAGGPLGASGSTVSLANTAVTAGTYANPVTLTVDAQGRITSVATGGVFMPGASWGSATGSALTLTGILPVPRPLGSACTIKEVLILTTGGTGSCTINIWKANLSSHYPPVSGDDITGGVPPAISGAATYRNSTLTGWTTTIAQDDVLYFTLTATSTFTSVAIFIRYG